MDGDSYITNSVVQCAYSVVSGNSSPKDSDAKVLYGLTEGEITLESLQAGILSAGLFSLLCASAPVLQVALLKLNDNFHNLRKNNCCSSMSSILK